MLQRLLTWPQGRHLVSHIQTERRVLAQVRALRPRSAAHAPQCRRLPALHSSMLGLEISLGKDQTIDFSDYLNGVTAPPHRHAHPAADPREPLVMGHVHAMTDASPYFK